MTEVSGSLKLVTGSPAAVSQVWLRAPNGRVQGSEYVTEAPDTVQVTGGEVSFDALPGAMVMTLISHGSPTHTVKLLVPDKTSATLAECIEAGALATDGTRSALERLALEVQAELGQVPSLVSDALAQDSTIIDAVRQVVSSYTGTGSPEGKVAAPVGSTYTDTAATNGAIRWIKTSGTGNTGWRDDYGDTTAALETKADKTYVDDEVDAAKWYRGGLGSSDSLDDLSGESSVGLHPVTGAEGGLPVNSPGTVHITYDPGSARTIQVYAPSSPNERVNMRRVHQGTWRDWEPTTYSGLYVSTGHVDDLTVPHVYAVAGTVAGLPVAENTSLEVMQAGAGTAQLIQRATTLEVRPRTFVRRRQWSRWDEWVEDGKDTSPAPITWDLVETTDANAQLIAGSMSHDRLTLFNSVGGPLRQSRDNGQTWEDVYTWPGSALEVTLPLANGEILTVTNSSYEGQTSMRRVWVSEGYDPDNPQAAKWVHKLTGSSRMVKFPEWSLNTWDNIVLASEYGPKGGMIWAGNPEPIDEGKNARYAYLSTDYGETWKQVFDFNSWLLSRGENTLKRHIHGIAWDPYWDRIWLTFGDHPTDDGSNGILYSDDFGDTWEIAYHSAEVDEHLGFQVVGIQPMRDCVLFAGDMTPAGAIRIDRAGGKYRDVWEFQDAWSLGDEHKILCHVIRHHQDGFGEVAFFGFAREGTASPSIIVATRDGYDWDLLWESDDAPSPGFRWMVGPTMDGQLIASVSRGGVWSELSGKIDLHNFTQSQLTARGGRLAAHRELVMTPERVGRIATEKAPVALHHYSGTGFPEGEVTAPVGATYTDTQATAGAIRWIKTSGTGNTGWTVEYGDTGWRDITTQSNVAESGNIFLRRSGNTVSLVFTDVQLSTRSTWQYLVDIPNGFKTAIRIDHRPAVADGVTTRIMNYPVGQYRSTGHESSSDPLDFRDMWETDQTWPSSLPGIPT